MKNKTILLSAATIFIINCFMGAFTSLFAAQNHFKKEDIVKNYPVIQKPSLNVVEIKCRTSNAPEDGRKMIRDLKGILLKESKIGQFDDGIGVFANRDFKKGEIVIKWDLKALSEEEYKNLPQYEKNNFCHHRGGIYWLYPDPERHVNRFHSPNVIPDFDKQANIALREIEKGEELSIADNTVEDF